MFIVYILRTSRNTLYVGQTNNLEKRLQEHKSKKTRGAKYTRSFDSVSLVYQEQFATRSLALKREYELKQLTHNQKENLIKGDTIRHKKQI
jgi:putative endonuclease